jgi:acyl transferase domain-containing protein
VRFADTVAELARVPERVFLEVGPGATLAGMVRRHPDCAGRTVIATLDEPGREPDAALFRGAAGALWAAGAPVKLGALWQGERRRRIPLPTYPFERRRHWADAEPEAAPSPSIAASEVVSVAPWGGRVGANAGVEPAVAAVNGSNGRGMG